MDASGSGTLAVQYEVDKPVDMSYVTKREDSWESTPRKSSNHHRQGGFTCCLFYRLVCQRGPHQTRITARILEFFLISPVNFSGDNSLIELKGGLFVMFLGFTVSFPLLFSNYALVCGVSLLTPQLLPCFSLSVFFPRYLTCSSSCRYCVCI